LGPSADAQHTRLVQRTSVKGGGCGGGEQVDGGDIGSTTWLGRPGRAGPPRCSAPGPNCEHAPSSTPHLAREIQTAKFEVKINWKALPLFHQLEKGLIDFF